MRKEYFTEASHQPLFSMYDTLKKKSINPSRHHKHHPELEIGFIAEGNGIYTVDNKSFDFKPGDVFFIRPNESHCIPSIESDEVIAFVIRINWYYMWNICADYIDASKIHTMITSGIPINSYFPKESGLGKKVEEIRELFRDENESTRFEIKRRILNLLIVIADSVANMPIEENSQKAPAHITEIQNAVNYINDNLAKQITLDDIAHAASMSRSYVSSYFKLVTGVSPYEYLLTARVEKAIRLLKKTDLPVTEIAQKCGFGSLSSFNKTFRKSNGVTPREYRLSHGK